MKRLSVIWLVSMLLCMTTGVYANNEFKLIRKNGPTHLYERWITVDKEQVRELKAVFSVRSDITSIVKLLQSQQHGTQWQTKASAYTVKMLQEPVAWINYIQYDLPAVMDDQDCLLLYAIPMGLVPDAQSCVVLFSSTADSQYPVKSGVKRISGVKGSWKLEKQPGELVQVTYTISSDRDKKIPRFISDPIIQDNVFKSMSNFKQLLEQ